jgi:plastocyanin
VRSIVRFGASVLLLVLLLTACQGGEDDGGGSETASFVAVDIDFTEAPEQVAAGAVEVELVNDGELPHNVVFEGVEGDSPVVEAGPGESATGTVELEPGEYTAYCGVPGHRDSGMEVSVTAE